MHRTPLIMRFFLNHYRKYSLVIGNMTRQSIITMLYGFYPSGLTFKEIKHRLGRIWTPVLLSHLGELQWGAIIFACYAGNDKKQVIEYRLTEFGHNFISNLISSWKISKET